ncbi:MAG TPA: hypothetical protein VJ652_15260 [Noviherbaspirillum sp.]|nr:hypothetical protein [Noviherbaspirillum sp.]
MENFILIQKERIAEVGIVPGDGKPVEVIKAVIRSYESSRRAEEDLALMQEMLPNARFEIVTVEHIDN